MKTILTLLLVSFFSILPVFAGQVGGEFNGPVGTISLDGYAPSVLIVSIISYAIAIAGIIGVIGTTWGGLQMILATGDDEKFKKARYMVIFSLLGVFIAGIAYSVVSIISSLKF